MYRQIAYAPVLFRERDQARGRNEKTMQLKLRDTMYRETDSGRNGNSLPRIHGPGMQGGCTRQVTGYLLQPRVQTTGQTTVSGFILSRIAAHDPATGEAG
jgi:hypothetical protein